MSGKGLLAVARLGLAHEFFGHLFETVTKVPHRFAKDHHPGAPDRRMPSLRSPGSPLRYFAPVAPVTLVSAIGSVIAADRADPSRRWRAVAAAGAVSSDAVTAYVVRALNTRLFVAGHPITPEEQERLLRTWYRLNLVRLALCGTALLAATKALATTTPAPTLIPS